jgi:hypothetical protein
VTFGRFSNNLKQRNGPRAASVLKVTAAGRKSSAGNSVNSSVLSIGSGPKALRRSWEGNVDIKGKINSESKTTKADRKPENKTPMVRKLLINDYMDKCTR